MNQRQFPASPNRFLTWLMLAAASVALAVLLAAPGVVWGENPSQPEFGSETAARSVDENTSVGENIGEPVGAIDSDADTLTYSLTGMDATAFGFDTPTGQITTKDALDHESKVTYTVTIGVSDSKDADGKADLVTDDTIEVTITVGDVNEPPEFASDAQSMFSAREGAAVGTVVATVAEATDPDASANLQYSLAGPDSGSFTIDDASRELKVNAVLDYETKTAHNATVVVTDGTLTDELAVIVTVTDVDEAPVISGNTPIPYTEGSASLVGTSRPPIPKAWLLHGRYRGTMEANSPSATPGN